MGSRGKTVERKGQTPHGRGASPESRTIVARRPRTSRLLAAALILGPPIVILVFGIGLAIPTTHRLAKDLIAEDRLVEWATFAFYFAGGVVGIALVTRLARLPAP